MFSSNTYLVGKKFVHEGINESIKPLGCCWKSVKTTNLLPELFSQTFQHSVSAAPLSFSRIPTD